MHINELPAVANYLPIKSESSAHTDKTFNTSSPFNPKYSSTAAALSPRFIARPSQGLIHYILIDQFRVQGIDVKKVIGRINASL